MNYLSGIHKVSRTVLPLFGVRHFRSTQCLPEIFIDIVNNDDFMDKVITSKVPVIVNFHADWCEPCKLLTPRLKALIEPKTNINLAIIDVEQYPELVQTFEVKAVPAVLAIKDGVVVDKFIGLVDGSMIEKLISKLEE